MSDSAAPDPALQAHPVLPAAEAARRTAPAVNDDSFAELLRRLNDGWRVAGSPTPQNFKQRVGYQVRRLLARLMGPQETFNAAVVQFINTLNTAAGPVLAALEDVDRHRDALAARERRMDAGMARLLAENGELRTAVAVLRQTAHDLAVRGRNAGPPEGRSSSGSGPAMATTGITGGETAENPAAAADPIATNPSEVLGQTYVGFEDRFRGDQGDIRARQADYAALFAGQSRVLDVGCGRGEFLTVLRDHGVPAIGLDVNGAMVAVCREKGLDAVQADALTYLRAQPPGSLGGLIAAQVVEHLEPAYLAAFLEAAFGALQPGAPIVLETINPACWFAFFESYVRDITHVRPLHPDTLSYLMVASGFAGVDIQYRAPYPEHDKLQPIPPSAALGDGVETLNANVEKINRLLFTYLDYAAVARKP
jgi:SAM-dependent methyltransferase